MSPKVEYGSHGTIESPLYNPTPPYNGDPQSPYHKSCQVSCLKINYRIIILLMEYNILIYTYLNRYGFFIINMVQTAVRLDYI